MDSGRTHDLIERIASTATASERSALIAWSDRLLNIHESKASTVSKLKDAVAATADATAIRSLITLIGREVTPVEIQTLSAELAELHSSSMTKVEKATRATGLVAAALKHLAWDNRSLPVRMGLAVAVVTAIAFGSQGAGIAALGTAIGVPLWLVFGAGAAFLGELYERLTGRAHRVRTKHTVIESDREDRA